MAVYRPTLAELTLLVLTPGNVHGTRASTEAERPEAQKYASEQGVEVQALL